MDHHRYRSGQFSCGKSSLGCTSALGGQGAGTSVIDPQRQTGTVFCQTWHALRHLRRSSNERNRNSSIEICGRWAGGTPALLRGLFAQRGVLEKCLAAVSKSLIKYQKVEGFWFGLPNEMHLYPNDRPFRSSTAFLFTNQPPVSTPGPNLLANFACRPPDYILRAAVLSLCENALGGPLAALALMVSRPFC